MSTTPICFVDTETDGIHPGRKLWDVAIIRRDEHGFTEKQFFVQIDLSTSDPFGLRVGRFYDRHPTGRFISGLEGERAPAEALRNGTMVEPWNAAEQIACLTHGAHLVGMMPSFDAEVCERLLRGNDLAPSWHHHLIDVEALAVGYLAGRYSCGTGEGDREERVPPSLPWGSDDLSRACNVEPPSEDDRHTAMGDARWALRLYFAILGGAG